MHPLFLSLTLSSKSRISGCDWVSKAFQQTAKFPSRTVTPIDIPNSAARGQFPTSQVEKNAIVILLHFSHDCGVERFPFICKLSIWFSLLHIMCCGHHYPCYLLLYLYDFFFSVKMSLCFYAVQFLSLFLYISALGVMFWNFPPFHYYKVVLFLNQNLQSRWHIVIHVKEDLFSKWLASCPSTVCWINLSHRFKCHLIIC